MRTEPVDYLALLDRLIDVDGRTVQLGQATAYEIRLVCWAEPLPWTEAAGTEPTPDDPSTPAYRRAAAIWADCVRSGHPDPEASAAALSRLVFETRNGFIPEEARPWA